MDDSSRLVLVVGLLVIGVVVGGVAVDEFKALSSPDQSSVVFLSSGGTQKGMLTVHVASTWRERYVGLSNTQSLGPDEGMLFVHDQEGSYAYVMRDMSFPIDIVFVNASQHVTIIHHAEVEEPPLTRYRGTGKWVIETPYNWTTRHDVMSGDQIQFAV